MIYIRYAVKQGCVSLCNAWKMVLMTHHGMLMHAAEEFAVSHITLAVQVKQGFSLKDWDEGTLDDMGCYTPQSDIPQVGMMLLKS